jgi:putative peptidoglycan lipid II flippase
LVNRSSFHDSIRSLKAYWQIWSNASINRKIFSATVLFGCLTLAIKVLAALKEIISASIFGVGDELDAFNVAFTITSFVVITIGAALHVAQVPVFIKTKKNFGEEEAQNLFGSVLSLCLLTLIITSLLLIIFLPRLLSFMVAGFSQQKLELTCWLTYIMLPMMLCSSLSLVITSVLNAEEQFQFGAISPGWISIGSIAALLLYGRHFGVYPLAIGITTGAITEFLFLTWAVRKLRLRCRLKWNWQNERIKLVIKNSLPITTASILAGLMPIVDQSFAAKLQAGDVAALGFGNRLIGLALTLFAAAVGTSVLPYFSTLAAEKKWMELKQVFKSNLYKMILPVSIILTIVIIVFSTGDTQTVARIQIMYALQLPAYAIGLVGARLLSAIHANNKMILITVVGLISNILLDYILSRLMGIAGISLSTSIVQSLMMILIIVTINSEIKKRMNE